MNASSLRRLYAELNAQFFRGRLPRYAVRCRRTTLPGEKGECDPARRTIFLSPDVRGDELRRTLFHEMCHIGTPGHGLRFRRKLERIGEPWAMEEARLYAEAVTVFRSTTATIARTLKDLACDCPRLRWIDARRHVAGAIGVRPRDVDRTAPWARDMWRRESTQVEVLRQHGNRRAV